MHTLGVIIEAVLIIVLVLVFGGGLAHLFDRRSSFYRTANKF